MTNGGGVGGGSFGGVTAPFQLEIEKYYQGEYWVNRYFLDSSDMAGALVAAESIYLIERAIHRTSITFTKYSVRTTVPKDYVYETVVLNTTGNSAVGSQLAPLFVVLRVDLGVSGSRPSRKYYRGVLTEDDIQTFTIIPASVTFYNTTIAPLADVAGLCDPQGQSINNAKANPNVGMRQLRRGSKKKPTP